MAVSIYIGRNRVPSSRGACGYRLDREILGTAVPVPGKVGIVLISLLFESRLQTSDLILQGLDSSLESTDLSSLVFDDILLLVVESLLLGQFIIQVVELGLKGSDGLGQVVVVLMKLAVVQPQP